MINPLALLSNLQQRIIVAILGIGLFVGLLYQGWQGAIVLFDLILAASLFEFYTLSPSKIPNLWKAAATLAGIVLFSILLLSFFGYEVVTFRLLFVFPPVLFISLVFSGFEKPFEVGAWLVLGWFYLITPWLSILLLTLDFEYNPAVFLGLFGLLWMADSGAYFAGKQFGKTKLLPRVSPKKSWEGLVGGLLASLALAWFLGQYVGAFSPDQWFVLAVSTTLAGTLGDLAESVLKRSLNLKDSGSILPGHGGILDRFDGLFVAAPVNLIIATFFFR